MSHFTVLVIGPDVEAQLQPFHEFECTGTDDEYVKDVDKTEEARAEYEKSTRSMVRMPDGTFVSAYDAQFYRDPTPEEIKEHGRSGRLIGSGFGGGISYDSRDWGDGRGYRVKVRDIPAHLEQGDIPVRDLEPFSDWAADYYGGPILRDGAQPDLTDSNGGKFGYVRVEADGTVKVIDRTNQQAHWDWYQIGGRWSGFFTLKPGRHGKLGQRGVMGSHANDGPGYADIARKGDIDFEAMRNAAGTKAGETYDRAVEILTAAGAGPWESWEVIRERCKNANGETVYELARSTYNGQPAVVALKASGDDRFTWDLDDDLSGPRSDYVQAARDRAYTTFAYVRDSKWTEKGAMAVHGKQPQADWNREFNELLDSLPDDTLLTVVDCHI